MHDQHENMIEKIKELELKNKSLNEIMKDKSKTL